MWLYLTYLQPEKIAQNKEFGVILDTLNRNGKLGEMHHDLYNHSRL